MIAVVANSNASSVSRPAAELTSVATIAALLSLASLHVLTLSSKGCRRRGKIAVLVAATARRMIPEVLADHMRAP